MSLNGMERPKGVILPELKIETLQLTIIGDTPLISHAWSQKSRRQMLDKHTKAAPAGRPAKVPQEDFRQSLYELKSGGYGFPSIAFKSAAVTACTSLAGITKVGARQAFHVTGEYLYVPGALPGVQVRHDLVRIEGAAPMMREDMVRVGIGKADIRYRGEFWPWFARLTVRFNVLVFSVEQILTLFNVAGFGVGVGEWRPEKDGQSGLFHVASDGEVETLLASLKEAA